MISLDLAKPLSFSPRGNRVLGESIAKEMLLPIIDKDVTKNSNIILCGKFFQVLENIKYVLFRKTAQSLESCEMKTTCLYLNSMLKT